MVFVTGDTHRSDLGRFDAFCRQYPCLSKNDYMIVAGDFGGVWSEKTLERDLKAFSELPFTVLWADGNHENFDLLERFPIVQWHGGRVHQIRPDIIHLMRGQIFELEGKSFFVFGGATSADRAWRTEGESWWRQELPSSQELDEGIRNLNAHENRVDYVITHSCSKRALMYLVSHGLGFRNCNCPEIGMLSCLEENIRSFDHWYFGHFHVDMPLSERYTAVLHEIIRIV